MADANNTSKSAEASNNSNSNDESVATTQFNESFLNYESYPLNLVDKSRFENSELARIRQRFEDKDHTLGFLVSEHDETCLAVWDVDKAGHEIKGFVAGNTRQKLQRWLGHKKPDPQTRLIFLSTAPGRSSGSPRKPFTISSECLKTILTYHQVFPQILEFLYCIGTNCILDEHFTPVALYSQRNLGNRDPQLEIPSLGRTGRGYQVCYCLKGIDIVPHEACDPTGRWMIKPATVYHQFNHHTGAQVWIIGEPKDDIRRSMLENLAQSPVSKEPCINGSQFLASLQGHLTCARWAAKGWTEHVEALEMRIHRRTQSQTYVFKPEEIVSTGDEETDRLEDVQPMSKIVRDLMYAITALEINVKSFAGLKQFYIDLVGDIRTFGDRPQPKQAVNDFSEDLGNIIARVTDLRNRAQLAVRIADWDRKDWDYKDIPRINKIKDRRESSYSTQR
ncbi:hypothetical protein QBC43DRAFT_339051 [Cladorrhinum sp. PSN259]|nr:hypothetical protein QBC43DRAFT_339051 [Cladorrhinum sp. PSN259]